MHRELQRAKKEKRKKKKKNNSTPRVFEIQNFTRARNRFEFRLPFRAGERFEFHCPVIWRYQKFNNSRLPWLPNNAATFIHYQRGTMWMFTKPVAWNCQNAKDVLPRAEHARTTQRRGGGGTTGCTGNHGNIKLNGGVQPPTSQLAGARITATIVASGIGWVIDSGSRLRHSPRFASAKTCRKCA